MGYVALGGFRWAGEEGVSGVSGVGKCKAAGQQMHTRDVADVEVAGVAEDVEHVDDVGKQCAFVIRCVKSCCV